MDFARWRRGSPHSAISMAQNSKISEPENLTMFPTLTRAPPTLPNSHSTSIEGAWVGNPRSESTSCLRLGRALYIFLRFASLGLPSRVSGKIHPLGRNPFPLLASFL